MNELQELQAAVKSLREQARRADDLANLLEQETCYASGIPAVALATARLINKGGAA